MVEQFNVGSLHVHWQPSDKYKTTTFVLQMKAPLEDEKTSAARALLTQVLQAGTKKYPSRREIRKHLDGLYGASFGADVGKKGEQHFVTFFAEVVHEQYLQSENEPLAKEMLRFFLSVLFEPAENDDGAFLDSIIKEEKQALISRVKSIADDKIRYANQRLVEEMCKEERYGIPPYGTATHIEDVDERALQDAYTDLLKTNAFDLFITGPGEREEIESVLNEYATQFTSKSVTSETKMQKAPEETREVVDHEDVQQAKLHMGFRVPFQASDNEYAAVLVTNGIFGAFPHSKLFVNVREKESLAYYAASRYEPYKGLVFAMAGIASDKYERAVTIIKEQLQELKNGNFTDEELQTTQYMLSNQILEQVDSARGSIDLLYQNVLTNKHRSVEDRVKEIQSVSREDVTRIASEITLDTVYLLTGKEDSQ
ncbi:EF-P 5-aminopentanol modification-associated protein YfmF [Geomicrobium sp. JSM 1781026]|uniref:EF-P 5-aminopentanol modification-associated protein YfmF n=1 Tax=Geomicrobium sp. JSM 1781026 TaxID=3344580 RepID=UPI0035C1C801